MFCKLTESKHVSEYEYGGRINYDEMGGGTYGRYCMDEKHVQNFRRKTLREET
jgi:hypothetical protein